MLRVMLMVLIITRISPAKCQENTESIVETTSSRGTTGTIFNDLVDAEFVGEGVTGFSGFIPDDTENVNTEGAHGLKDFIQTTWPRENFTTFTTPVTLFQTENIVQDKETVSEANDITSTNNVTGQYYIQTTTNSRASVTSTIVYDERTISKNITEFTTKESSLSENTKHNSDDINFDYTYDDVYSDQDDISSTFQKDISNLLPIEDPPPIDNISVKEISSITTDERDLMKRPSNFSDAINESDINNVDSTTTIEETRSTNTYNFDKNRDQTKGDISEEYNNNVIHLTTASILTTSGTLSDEITFDFDTEESIITIPSIVMEQVTTKIDLTREENSLSNNNSGTVNSDIAENGSVLSTTRYESEQSIKTEDQVQTTPITVSEKGIARTTVINNDINTFEDFETPEYKMTGENLDESNYESIIKENTGEVIYPLKLEELVNDSINDKNILSSDTTTENGYTAILTILPSTISRGSEKSISNSSDLVTLEELFPVETSTSTKINYEQTLGFSKETVTNAEKYDVYFSTATTEESTSLLNSQTPNPSGISYSTSGIMQATITDKDNLVYSSTVMAEESTASTENQKVVYTTNVLAEESTSSRNPHITKESKVSTTSDILQSNVEVVETTTTEKNNSSSVMIAESTIVPSASLNPEMFEQDSTSENMESTTNTNEVPSTFQEYQDSSENYLDGNNTENLMASVSMEELTSTEADRLEEISSDEFYDTTPANSEEASIETTTNIIHIWLAQASTKKSIVDDASSTLSEDYTPLSTTTSNIDETIQEGSTIDMNDIESTVEITERIIVSEKSEATTFQTTTRSTNGADDSTTTVTNVNVMEHILRKLEMESFEATTKANLEAEEEVSSEEVRTSTPLNTISTSTEILKYIEDHNAYKLSDTEFTLDQTTPSKFEIENMQGTTRGTRYRYQKKLTDDFAIASVFENSTNDTIVETTTSNGEVDKTTEKPISIKLEELLTTEERDLQNSVIESSTHAASNEEDESSTIFSKELIDNGQFTADAINILKEGDYETTENVKLFGENTDFHENTEIPAITITDDNIYSFITLPPSQKFETSDEFEKQLETIEHSTVVDDASHSTTKYTTTDFVENEENTEHSIKDIAINKWDGGSETAENSKSSEIHESEIIDYLPISSTTPPGIVKTSHNEENIFNIITTTTIKGLITLDFKEESEIAQILEEMANNSSKENHVRKLIASEDNIEDSGQEEEVEETNTKQLLPESNSKDITKTISEDNNVKEAELDRDSFENENIEEEIVDDNNGNSDSSEEDYKYDQNQNHTEEDQFQKDAIITTDTIISSMKELEELENETINQTHTALKVSDDLTTSLNSFEDVNSKETLTRAKINNGEQELFSKYVFKTYIDRTTTEREPIDNHEILSTPDDFENLLKGENVNTLEHILTDRDAKVNMSEEKVKNWPKLSLNDLVEEENHYIDENNEEDEIESVKLSEDEIVNETSENSYTDPASVNYYDEDYTNSEESNSTEGIDSDGLNESSTPYLTIISNREHGFCLEGNISLRMLIGEHIFKVPEDSQVFVNCTDQTHKIEISWRDLDLEISNSTISISIDAAPNEYFIDSVEVIHIDTLEAIKSLRGGLVLLTTPIAEMMTGSFAIDFENGYQLEVTDLNLRLKKVVEYSDSEQASQAEPIISSMTIIIICTLATSCLIFLVAAIILYRKITAKATIYKMTIE